METAFPVKSAQRVLELLEYFSDTRRPATVKEVSTSLGYPQSSTSVLLKSLADLGYFDHDSRTGMYMPNLRIALATAWIHEDIYNTHNLLRLMEALLERSGHTVMIGTQEGISVRYLHVLQATRAGRFTTDTGTLRPLFRSASGKMLLTTKTDREVETLLRKANSLERDMALRVDLEAVRDDLATARRAGYAVSAGTSVPGAGAFAVLLPIQRGQKPLTLSVGGPLRELKREKAFLLSTIEELVAPFRRALST